MSRRKRSDRLEHLLGNAVCNPTSLAYNCIAHVTHCCLEKRAVIVSSVQSWNSYSSSAPFLRPKVARAPSRPRALSKGRFSFRGAKQINRNENRRTVSQFTGQSTSSGPGHAVPPFFGCTVITGCLDFLPVPLSHDDQGAQVDSQLTIHCCVCGPGQGVPPFDGCLVMTGFLLCVPLVLSHCVYGVSWFAVHEMR